MQYWLLKTEPNTWSWIQQCQKGSDGEWWDGVRNHQASNNMKNMKKGDQGFFYHSGKNASIMGTVTITEKAVLDPSDPKGKFYMVKVQAEKTLPTPVTLKILKKEIPSLSILRQSRLSVAPVQKGEWDNILILGGLEPPSKV